jgi:hypothetical protein
MLVPTPKIKALESSGLAVVIIWLHSGPMRLDSVHACRSGCCCPTPALTRFGQGVYGEADREFSPRKRTNELSANRATTAGLYWQKNASTSPHVKASAAGVRAGYGNRAGVGAVDLVDCDDCPDCNDKLDGSRRLGGAIDGEKSLLD